jgi:hypothetical protein
LVHFIETLLAQENSQTRRAAPAEAQRRRRAANRRRARRAIEAIATVGRHAA